MVFLALCPLCPLFQILNALLQKATFALVGLDLGAKLLNFGLQRTGFRGCFRCFSGCCNSLHSTVPVPVSIFPPFQLCRVDTVGTMTAAFNVAIAVGNEITGDHVSLGVQEGATAALGTRSDAAYVPPEEPQADGQQPGEEQPADPSAEG